MISQAVTSTTTGKIFHISYDDFIAGVNPSKDSELLADHPFSTLWLDFRTKITTPRKCERLIDAYVSVFLRNENWADGLSLVELASNGDKIISLIRDNPPDLLILDQPVSKGYGLHLCRPGRWPYICITKYWFDDWTHAMAFGPNRRLALALEALLRATLVHEISHWIFALSVGPHSQEYLDAFDQQNLSSLSTQATEGEEQKATPKSMRADWTQASSGGEAGSYVEQIAGGGIIGFNFGRDDVSIRTDADHFWSPSTHFLSTLRYEGYTFFTPGPWDYCIPMPDPSVFIHFPGQASSIPSSSFLSHPCIFTSDCCDAAEERSADFIVDIPKHSGDRILAPSVVKYQQERMLIGLGLTNY